MKTFSEFISERYYEPDEPLPSGKTPYGKATSSYYRQKGEYFRGGRQNTQTFARIANQIDRINNQVRRGADNPEFDSKPDRSGRYVVNANSRFGLEVYDRKSDTQMRIRQKDQIAPGNKPVYDIEWSNYGKSGGYSNSPSGKMNPGQARGVIRSVADMWKNQVAPRIPSNVVLTNFPISNDTSERNTRSKLYSKVAGFGNPGMQGRQYAAVNRPPSPRQAAKGAERITPLSGNLDPEWVYNRRELDQTARPPHKPAGWWAAKDRANRERRKIAPATPSRPSLRQATQALQTTSRVQAPSLPRPSASSIPVSSSRLRLRGRAGLAAGLVTAGLAAYSALNRPKK